MQWYYSFIIISIDMYEIGNSILILDEGVSSTLPIATSSDNGGTEVSKFIHMVVS